MCSDSGVGDNSKKKKKESGFIQEETEKEKKKDEGFKLLVWILLFPSLSCFLFVVISLDNMK